MPDYGRKQPQVTEPKPPATPKPPAAPPAPAPPPSPGGTKGSYSSGPSAPRPPRVEAPPALLGQNPLAPHDAVSRAVAAANDPNYALKQARRAAVILRRQNLLHGLGLYKGQIDGLWGAQSQKAWSIYVWRRRNGKILNAPFIGPEQLVAQERKAARAGTVQQTRQAARIARQQSADSLAHIRAQTATKTNFNSDNVARDTLQAKRAATEVQQQLARETRVNVATMAKLKSNPGAAASVTLHQLTAAIVDKANGWKPTNRDDVLVVQRWLNTHGHAVALTGAFDKQTNDSLKLAYAQTATDERNAAIHDVVTHFYGAGWEPGQRPAWWAAPGPVPTPGELLDRLRAGGFSADALLKQILRNANTPQYAYADWRDQQLQAMLTTYKTVWDAPNWIASSGGVGDTAMNVLLRANRVLSPKAQTEFASQLRTLVNSRTGDEFSRRIAGAIKAADRQYTVEQAARAKKHTPWWGTAAHYAVYPLTEAEKGVAFGKTAFIVDFYMGADLITTALSGERPHLTQPLENYWGAAQQAQVNAPLGLRLANEFVADPLIFLRPFRIGSTAVKYGLRIPLLERDILGGYKLAEAGGRYGVLSRRVAYDEATWHIPIKTALGVQLRRVPFVDKALKLKSELVDAGQAKVIAAARHGFTTPRKAFAMLGEHTTYESKLSTETRDMLAQARDLLSKQTETAHPVFLDALKEVGGSLYADAYRSNLSRLGNRVVARWAEEIRVQEVHRLANHYSQDVYDRAVSGGFTQGEANALMAQHGVQLTQDGIVPIPGKNGSPIDFHAAIAKLRAANPEPPLSATHAAQRAFDAYNDVKRKAGLFFAGAGDPELTSVVDKRVASLLEQFKEVTLPAIQDTLETHFEAVGHELWDANGLWIGATGDASAADAFAAFEGRNLVTLPNPLYGQEMTLAQAIPVMESEIRRKHARILNWADTERASGNAIPDAAIAKLLGDQEGQIKRAFVEGDFEYHVNVDRDAVNRLLDSLNLPRHTPVDVEWRPGSKAWGEYHGGRARIYADPEALKTIEVAGDAAHTFIEAQYRQTVMHEIRHAFQDATWPQDLYNDHSAGYWDSPIEKDARAFSEGPAADTFTDLVTISRPKGGTIVDTRRTLSVPDIYARDHPEAFGYMSPRWIDATTAQTYGDRSAANLLGPLAGAPVTADRTPLDEEIGRSVWNLGSLHADTLGQDGFPNFARDTTARSFNAPRGTPHDDWAHAADLAAEQRRATQMYHIALGRATAEALPYAMLENHLFMVALGQAQSAPFRAIYKTLDGVMNTWIFATLPLRSGWVVRNVFDNAIKSFIAGAKDPRDYFRVYRGGHIATAIGTGLEHTVSVFDAGMGQLLETVRFLDTVFGTNGADHFEGLLDTFWTHKLDVIDRVFKTQGWNVPPEVLEGARLNPFQRRVGGARLTKTGLFAPDELAALPQEFQDAYAEHFAGVASSDPGRYTRFRNAAWHLMANTPENYYKKVIYNTTLRKLRADGMSAVDAHAIAWKKVEDTLFDYSKITGIEDNLRIFMPFIQFWRKNTGLWARNFAQHPWLSVELNNYLRERDSLHADEPAWMRRYINVKEITDAAAVVPGLGWLAKQILPSDGQFDPLSFASFSPYYRAFKADNPSLPADQQGNSFFGPMIDALNDWGLGMSPFFRKPLESAHIASVRSWQTVFPQTALASAITRKFFGDTAAGYVMDWERIFTLMQGRTPSDQLAQNFEFYVRREQENQIALGQPVNRKQAEATIRSWFLAQNLWGYFGGIYFRRNTPEDYYTAKLQDDVMTGHRDYKTLPERDKTLLGIWKNAGIDKTTGRLRMDQQQWTRYIESIPLIQAFFKQPSYAAGASFLHDHPEITQYVDPKFTKGHYYGANYAKAAAMYLHGAEFFDVNTLLAEVKLPYEMRKAATAALLTPELETFWAKNDTPADLRHKMIAGELHSYLNDLNESYWAIPKTDFAARSGFLAAHPELERSWQHNNSPADDFHAIDGEAKGALREAYFATVREHGFQAAAGLLKQYSFMFEGTKSESHIDEARGIWIPGGKGSVQGKAYLAAYDGLQHYFALRAHSKTAAYAWLNAAGPAAKAVQFYFDHFSKGHNTARAIAFRAARSALQHYFDLRDHGHKAAASAWLNADTPEAKLARDYFKHWGSGSSYHAHDYMRARPWLKLYWALPAADRAAWLKGNAQGASIVRRYFAKWGVEKGMNAHALAYVAAKSALDHYFSIKDRSARAHWLKSGSKDALAVLNYFKVYGHANRLERAFRTKYPSLVTTDPELRRRLDFWHNYYSLTPDLRPAYVISSAEDYGVFVFGALGDGDAHNREQKFIRDALAATLTVDGKATHISRHEATYLYVKPLLNQLYAIPNKDRQLFIDANPELKQYLATYSHPTFTGHKGLDAKIASYFTLPQGSPQRAAYLAANADVQAYFIKKSSPAQRAMFALLDTFFSLDHRRQAEYKLFHPEIQAYFDRLRLEQSQQNAVDLSFDQSDPRLHDYWAGQTADYAAGSAHMLSILREAHIRQYTPGAIGTRRDRQPSKDPGLGGKKIHKAV